MAKNTATTPAPEADAELYQLTQEQADEIEARVAEAVANTKAEMEATLAETVAAAVAKAVAEVKAAAPAASVSANVQAGGIYDPNPLTAKIAREKSKKKKVIATQRGYYGVSLIEEGQVFDVPVDEKADWFEDYKGASGKTAEEELV